MIIGERLKQCRQQQQLSQETVATKLKVSRQTISNWENSRSYPDIERCIHLADLYELSLDELLREDQKMVKNLINATNLVKTGRLAYVRSSSEFSYSGWVSFYSAVLVGANTSGATTIKC